MLIKDGPRWSWQGAVAVTLALGIFVTLTLISSGLAWKLARGLPLAPVAVNLLTATFSALVGAVATFLGKVARPTDVDDHPHGPGAVVDQPVFTAPKPDGAAEMAEEEDTDVAAVPVAEPRRADDDDTVIRPAVPEEERP